MHNIQPFSKDFKFRTTTTYGEIQFTTCIHGMQH